MENTTQGTKREKRLAKNQLVREAFQPTHEMFADWTLDLDRFSEVRVSLGCASGLEREAGDDEGMICVATPVYKTGGLAGSGAHAGFVVRLPFDALVEGGFSEDEIWLSQGANEATRVDETGPVCEECCLAAFSREYMEALPETDTDGQACWSCSQMIEESNTDRLRTDY